MYRKIFDTLLNKEADCILRLSDNASIPKNPDNRDYAEFLAWEAAGGQIEEAEVSDA